MRSAVLVCLATPAMAPWLAAGASAEVACHNAGAVVAISVLGKNEYCPGGTCTNDGLILLVGRTESCHGNGRLVGCVDDTCVAEGDDQRAAHECGVIAGTACWAERFACHFLNGGNVDLARPTCECWPDDPACSGSGLRVRSDGLEEAA